MPKSKHHPMTVRHQPSSSSNSGPLALAPPKRKKGRPSLLDLQQRKLLQQQKNAPPPPQNPNPLPRSSRRTHPLPAQFLLGSDSDTDTETPHPDSDPASDSDHIPISKKLRRLSSNLANEEKVLKATDTQNDSVGPTYASTSAAAGNGIALPDRKLLLLVLDKLQKKDTRGVFADPVDPEELPDYHEVIEKPMDFGTLRSNLDRGRYKTLEQFEDDVYLISSNAMQYNPPSSIFFRQARSIQEIAKKEFETLRHDVGISDPQPKPKRGRPPGSRNLKKLLESSPVEHVVVESPPEPTPISREDDTTRSGSYNLRKGPSLYRLPRKVDNCFEFSASSSRYMPMKYGKKPCGTDENRRETYCSSQVDSDQDISAALGGSERQLIAVGLASEYGYARSLARFAANLGPVVWGIVSKKIRNVLPPNVDFGPGWVEEVKEADAGSTQVSPFSDKLVQSNSMLQDSFTTKPHTPLTQSFTNSTFNPKLSASENFGGAGDLSYNGEWSQPNNINGVLTPDPSFNTQRGINSFSSGPNPQFQEISARQTPSSFFTPPQLPKTHAMLPNNFQSPPLDYQGMMSTGTVTSAHEAPYWKNLPMQERWDQVYPAELNGGFQASSSRNSSLPIGSPPQLDLVLQL